LINIASVVDVIDLKLIGVDIDVENNPNFANSHPQKSAPVAFQDFDV
jgi:hypothetical protein